MKISKVTMTGADDSISPYALIDISKAYPFVEWGILRSRSQNGGNRFPSQEWLGRLAAAHNQHRMQLCAHLCGKFVREVLEDGQFLWLEEPKEYYSIFERIQLNFHAEKHTMHPDFIKLLGQEGYDFIFQMDGTAANENLYHEARRSISNVFPLFDVSGGIGAVPDTWPTVFPGQYCGYAGGLGPDSIAAQLDRIEAVTGDAEIWIDMETRIRSMQDRKFDLDKVVACLEVVAQRTKGRGENNA